MYRILLSTVVLSAGFATAGELDREAKAVPVAPTAKVIGGGELDKESPTAAHNRRNWGYGDGWGYGGYSYYGGYRPMVSVGFSSYYPSYSYYRPSFYYSPAPTFYSGYYGGSYCW
jgi:hypothetical protein